MDYKTEIKKEYLYLKFHGDLIGEDQDQSVYEKIKESIDQGITNCAIDLSGVRYINSSGIGILITVLTKFRNKGGEVILINPSEHVKKLLVITKLTNIFKVVTDEKELSKAFKL